VSGDPLRHLIERYLREVDEALGDLPPTQRREILDDLQSHIHDALAAVPEPDEATLRSILDRLGTPDELAREARERLGIVGSPPEPDTRRRPGIVETIAVVTTAIVWPLGLLLVWLSGSWRTRDKVIATASPVFGFAFAMLMLIPVSFAVVTGSATPVTPGEVVLGPQPTVVVPPETPVTMPAPEITHVEGITTIGIGAGEFILLLGALFGTPFLSAAYLAFQLRHSQERQQPTARVSDAQRLDSGLRPVP
jgi:uncharacterized membrane protein